MLFNSNIFFLGDTPVSQIFFRDQTLTKQLTASASLPSYICVSNSGSVSSSTYTYQPGFGGISEVLYYNNLYGTTYYIRYSSLSNLYELVYFQSIFNKIVLYSRSNLLGTWSQQNGVLPTPVITEGTCPT